MPPHENPHHARRWAILAVLGIAQLMVVLDATIVNIALPSAQRDLGFSNDSRQWIVTAYALAFGSLLLLGGRIGDLFGRKRTFIAGLLGFAVASAIGGAAGSFGVLVAARAAQGVFGALLAPAALGLLTTTFTDPSERAKAFGIFGAIAGGGAAIGLLLGGLLTEYASWRWCLYVNLLFAIPAAVAAFSLLHNVVPAHRPKLDVPGTITATTGLFALVYGFSHAETTSWSDPLTVGMLASSAVLLVSFVLIQLRSKNPLLPLRIVLDRGRGGAYLAMGLAGAGMFGVFLFLTFYLQNTLGFSPIQSGLAFLPMSAAIIATATTATTRLVPRLGAKPLVMTGMTFAAGAMAFFAQLQVDSTYAAAHPPGPGAARRRPRPRVRAGLQHRDRRRRQQRRGRRLGDGQHQPAGRRLGRHRAALHAGRQRRHQLRRRPRHVAGRDGRRGGPRLHDRVLLVGGDLRPRRDPQRDRPALRRPRARPLAAATRRGPRLAAEPRTVRPLSLGAA